MSGDETLQLAHGGGGLASREFIEREILPRFGDGPLAGLPDGATLPAGEGRLVFTTDSFVVHPLEFPGGNIGSLAVHGTVNDLSVCAGIPQWLSLSLIIEEGLRFDVLRRILDSVRDAARACGVAVATGDTKVVARGQADGLYVNTAGIGRAMAGFDCSADRLADGDRVLVSGPVGDHGMAVMAAREAIDIRDGPRSDSAPVHRLVQAVADLAGDVRFMRDPTRGGTAAVLNEAVRGRAAGILLEEAAIPVSPRTRAVAELLGIDILHVACEGRVILICAPGAAAAVLDRWRRLPEGRGAAGVGSVSLEAPGAAAGVRGRVILRTLTGGRRLVDVPRGELLPRIC